MLNFQRSRVSPMNTYGRPIENARLKSKKIMTVTSKNNECFLTRSFSDDDVGRELNFWENFQLRGF